VFARPLCYPVDRIRRHSIAYRQPGGGSHVESLWELFDQEKPAASQIMVRKLVLGERLSLGQNNHRAEVLYSFLLFFANLLAKVTLIA
jgi:hypothetical protein